MMMEHPPAPTPGANSALVGSTGTKPAKASDAVRTCLVTGEECAKDAMIRFVVAPDHSIVPDLARNLPGRGLWVVARRAALTAAITKNLFARAAKQPVRPAADLVEQTAALARARCLNLLGLARSAGIATLGQMQVESAVKAGKISLLFIADDAGRDVEKLGAALKDMTLCRAFPRNELGGALGHDQLVYIGLAPHKLTRKIRDAVALFTQLSSQTIDNTETDN